MKRGEAGGKGHGDDEHRHVLLGHVVRKGLERSHKRPAQWARALPPRVFDAYRHRAPRPVWAIGLAAMGTVAAAAAVLLIVRKPERQPPLAFVLETDGGAPAVSPPLPAEVQAGVVRFSDGSAVAVRPQGRVRLAAVTALGAEVQLLEGRARARVSARPSTRFAFTAGPYSLEARAGELELSWHDQPRMFTVSLFSGQVVVHGPATAEAGVVVRAGETLMARAGDGFLRVGRGRALLDALPREDADRVSAALSAVVEQAAAEPRDEGDGFGGDVGALAGNRADLQDRVGTLPSGSLPGSLAGLNGSGDRTLTGDDGACRLHETSLLAAAVPDPGPVSLATCRHVDPGPSGKDVKGRPISDLWVKPGPNGCLRYAEDARGNRVPDFSHVGYRSGGVPLPRVAAPAGSLPLVPGDAGDDTAAIQAAIDAVAALPPDDRGIRGAVELGPGTFTVAGTLKLLQGGVVLRGHGSDPATGTVLRAVGNPRTLIQVGPKGVKRRSGGRESYAITDVYVPVGARSFTLSNVRDLKPGDDIIVHRPKTQRWICAIGTDVLPSRVDGRATPPWKASGMLTFERRVVRIDGNRVVVDAPLTNALEREFTQAYVTKLEFPERIAEVGIENLGARWELPAGSHCPTGKEKVIQVNSAQNAWVKNVRVQGFGGEAVTLGSPSKWVTVEDVTYVGHDEDKCADQWAFRVGGQQNLILRGRTTSSYTTVLYTDTEVEGPNAVVDFLAVGDQLRVRVASRWSTGILFDNVRIQDASGQPAGDFDLARGRSTHGWSAVNSVVWNSEAEVFSVDDPPTAHNWIMGGATRAKALLGTGTYSAQRSTIQPQSLYRAQLAERLRAATR
jgi:hypothetical protein